MQGVEFASQFRIFHMGGNGYNIDIYLTMVNVVIIIVLVVVFMFKIKSKLCCMYEKTTFSTLFYLNIISLFYFIIIFFPTYQTKITQIFTKNMKTATNLPINN
jgi:uncharacterized membrane-anchored protein YitT (DUF2179 family)